MLQVSENPDFQRKEWRVQRIGWACMTVLLLGGVAGLGGSGVLSSRTAATAGGDLVLQYERFVRRDARTSLQFRLRPVASGDPAISISADYLDHVTIRSITPAPREVRLGGDRQVFVFARVSPDSGGRVALELEPTFVGSLEGEAGLVGGASLAFHQLVLP